MLKVEVPVGESGRWSVQKFEITKTEAALSLFSYGGRAPSPGHYTRLMGNGQVVMSDTRAEIMDHYWLNGQRGVGLIHGLGLGVGLILALKTADFVFVVENSKDVISLVAPHYLERYGDRIEIIYADALTYRPPKGQRFDFVWHDIWPDICADNLEEMTMLKRRYGRLCGGNQACWCENECRRRR